MTLHDELERSLDQHSPAPDLDRLAAAARRRGGGRRRHRRTAALGLAAVVAGAGVVGGASALVGGRGSDTTIAADAPVADPVGPNGAEAAATPRGVAAALDWAIAQERSGTASDYAGQGGTASVVGDLYAELQWHDADGLGTSVVEVNVQLVPNPGGDAPQQTATDRVQTADGTGIRRSVQVARADGFRISVTATNGFDRGGDGHGGNLWDVTRATPPLTVAQLRVIAEQPFWGRTLPQSFEDAAAHLSSYIDIDARSMREWTY